jgi:serine phosphatase RsbU (regulator of sigma subunit)
MADVPSTNVGDAVTPGMGVTVPSSFPSSLALPATGREVAQFVALRAAACVGADYSNLALLTADGSSLRLFHSPFLDAEISARYTDVPLSAAYPIAVAARDSRVVLLSDLDSYQEEFPGLVADTIAAGIQATASLPLYRLDGTLLGAIGYAWAEPTSFDRKLEAALRAVAFLCVETVERAERYDADHDLILALQNRLLGNLPVLAGTDIFARYLTASSEASVGGDWYEGLLLGEGRIALIVGDVVGHGITAAADMALIRGMISALLHAHIATSQIFTELTRMLIQCNSPLLATAALAVIDIPTSTLTFATAGHPPPMLRLPDGSTEKLDTANGMMIGVSSDSVGEIDAAPFPLGSQLVMYTDGLVERRDRPLQLGIDQAVAHLAALSTHLAPRQVIESLHNALIGDKATDDDIAVLVVEHVAEPSA